MSSPRHSQQADPAQEPVHTGRLVKWADDRGFGFILPDGGGDTVFVHISDFRPFRRRPAEGDTVFFQVDRSERRSKAVNVSLKALPLPDNIVVAYGVAILCLTIFFLYALGLVHLAVPIATYLVMSIVTFGFYYVDKKRAESKQWRIHSTTLHVLEAIGGWPGALLAMAMLRHLTRKRDHIVMLCAIIAIHLLAWLVWFFIHHR